MRSRFALSLVAAAVLASAVQGQTAAPTKASGQAAASPQQAQAPEPAYKVGDMAPDFTLKDHNRQDVTLSSFRGKKNVVLAFYIFAFTGG